ncbi:DUF86 domain-containing protein [Microcystis aeruginosa FACHB-524]|uniref:HepT-like ribonuclease domain-containing protein n=1 Tax=Microcystis aeruginosa TaxID=1126 RepID=UPI002181EEEF|nr:MULTISPECIES: HepT-like ribonuclease domain-containing protein [unclassified Microcystis]
MPFYIGVPSLITPVHCITQTEEPEFKARYPAVPWRDASDLRNLTIHEYFRINLEIIWDIVENDIPPLKGQIEAILQEFI